MRKRFIVMTGLFLLLTSLQAQTTYSVTKTWSGPEVSIDGCGNNCFSLPGVALDWPDVLSGSHLFDVNVSVTWTKTVGTCTVPGTGCAFHNEDSFSIVSPSNSVVLANPGTWSGCYDIGTVTTTFNQGGPLTGGGFPITESVGPDRNLNDLNGLLNLQIGTWNLRAGNNTGGDPLCISSYSIT